MKRRDFINLAIAGVSTGLIITSPLSAETNKKIMTIAQAKSAKEAKSSAKNSDDSGTSTDPNDGNIGYHVMSEEELLLQLSPEGIKMYNSLNAEGKGLALLVASARCDGTNECKGLNACQSEGHQCAGKGDCKGKGKCAFSDKNLAVKLVRDKMAAKRAGAINGRK